MQALVRYSLLCMSFFLFSTFFLAGRLPEKYHKLPLTSNTGNSDHRIAIILPYTTVAASDDGSDNVASVLPYFPAFCTGAAGAADIADFLIFHTGVLDQWPLLKSECPENVKFIDLGSHAGLAERLLRVVDHKETTVMDKAELLQLITSFIKVNPYGLVEFKPALGHIFQDYLQEYTHWGYSDIDILFGDLGRWITPDELTDFDIVTYTFGDQQRLYLRGQFTFHKNAPATTNQLWRKCDYLSDMDVRFQKLVEQSKKYRVESAEGCYSAVVLNQNDIAVKFAVKAWTDIHTDDTVYSHGVFLSRSHKTGRQVLYKASEVNIEVSGRQISRLQPGWFEEEDSVYKNRKILMQREVGPRERVEHEPDSEANCMYWALQKYQSKLCVKSDIYKDDTVFWINGELYKQHYENAVLETRVETAPFFHFQEWKRSYRFGQLSSLSLSSPFQTFVLVPEGVIPMIEGKRTDPVPSPLGLSPMKEWKSANDRSQLPDNTYCLVSDVDVSGQHARCIKAASWHSADQTMILAGAPSWVNVDIESDVTLLLTLQISASQVTNQRALHNIIDHVKVSLNRWHGQPCVVVIYVSGSTEEALNYLKEQLGVANNAASYSSLIAVVHEKSPTEVSRKALMNMAIDAVPTRWYLSGLELERGLSISVDTAFFAHRAAAAHGRLRGNIFILPEFGLADFDTLRNERGNGEETDIVISISDLIDARRKGKCKDLSEFDEACDNNDTTEALSSLGRVESLWWGEAHLISDSKQRKEDSVVGEISRRGAALKTLEHTIFKLATGDNQKHMMYAMDESPLLLTDNLGPHDGIRTNEIAREVETFAGLRCFNSIRLSQLSILGYTFDVLGGAFAASSDASRKAAQSGSIDRLARCDGCTMFKKDKHHILNAMARGEIERAAKTSIVWAESIGLKQ